jgi:hypothetical protein
VVLPGKKGKIDISCLISSFPHQHVRSWRTAMRRRVPSLQSRHRRGQRAFYTRPSPFILKPYRPHSPPLFPSSVVWRRSAPDFSRVSRKGYARRGARWRPTTTEPSSSTKRPSRSALAAARLPVGLACRRAELARPPVPPQRLAYPSGPESGVLVLPNHEHGAVLFY